MSGIDGEREVIIKYVHPFQRKEAEHDECVEKVDGLRTCAGIRVVRDGARSRVAGGGGRQLLGPRHAELVRDGRSGQDARLLPEQ